MGVYPGIDDPRLDYVIDAFGRFMAGARATGTDWRGSVGDRDAEAFGLALGVVDDAAEAGAYLGGGGELGGAEIGDAAGPPGSGSARR